jgi:single-strand DNA-binding protein
VLWRSEKLAEYLVKGQKVYVRGRLQTRSYEGKDGVQRYAAEVVAIPVILTGSNPHSEQEPRQSASKPATATSRASSPPQLFFFAPPRFLKRDHLRPALVLHLGNIHLDPKRLAAHPQDQGGGFRINRHFHYLTFLHFL